MPSVAEQLRTARETRNMTVVQAAETTKIRTDHIRALEDGNYNAFSAPVYIRGFVRCYATLLKLDVPTIMADLDKELAGTTKFREPPPLTEHTKGPLDFVMLQVSKIDWTKSVTALAGVVVVGVVVCLVILWRHHYRRDPLAGLPPAVYRPANSGNTLPLTPPPAQRNQ